MSEERKPLKKIFIGKIKGVDTDSFTVEAVVSDESIDRYGETILVNAYKKRLNMYKKHGVLLSSHDYSDLRKQIGEAKDIRIKDGELVAKFQYYVGEGNPEADWAWKLASKYKRAAFSVGFLPYDYTSNDWDDPEVRAGKKPCRTYTDVELLEISQVLVPANGNALQKHFEISELDDVSKVIIKEFSEEVIDSLEDEDKIEKDVEDDIETKNIEEEEMKEILDSIVKMIDELKKSVDDNNTELKKSFEDSISKIELRFDQIDVHALSVEELKETVNKHFEVEVKEEVKEVVEDTVEEKDVAYIMELLTKSTEELEKRTFCSD